VCSSGPSSSSGTSSKVIRCVRGTTRQWPGNSGSLFLARTSLLSSVILQERFSRTANETIATARRTPGPPTAEGDQKTSVQPTPTVTAHMIAAKDKRTASFGPFIDAIASRVAADGCPIMVVDSAARLVNHIGPPTLFGVLLVLCGCGKDVKVGEQWGTNPATTSASSDTETPGTGSDGAQGSSSEGVGTQGSSVSDSRGDSGAASDDGPATEGEDSHGGLKFDIEKNEGGGLPGCGALQGDVEECMNRAPPDSFEPEIQWIYEAFDSVVTPMVANLTDDNGDGVIDIDDIPDVVIVGADTEAIHVLDGATGALHFQIGSIAWWLTPSLGDIDSDGVPEIVTGKGDCCSGAVLLAYEHDGTPKWTSQGTFGSVFTATALADLDNDGDVEILAGDSVYDHLGNKLWGAWGYGSAITTSTAVDLDGDGDLEITFGDRAFHHDGALYYQHPSIVPGLSIFPQIGNFDDDDDPEIVVGHSAGITMLEHDGTEKLSVAAVDGNRVFAGTVHDFDGDCVSEFATCSGTQYTVYKSDLSVFWSATVRDASGDASSTAFDFLGDGISEAIYADETYMWVYNGNDGNVFFQTGRGSGTVIEYPTVADVDNDGSAEIIVVSDRAPSPSIQVIRDKQDRWIQARRIWNQHTYHVTNVEEDGTIPQFETPNWKTLNTFRTNAQIESGGICRPPVPEG